MRFTVTRSHLKALCQGAGKILGKHSHLPVLENLRLTAKAGTVTAEATNLDEELAYTFPATGPMLEGVRLLPFAELKTLAKGGGDDAIEIATLDNDRVTVSTPIADQVIGRTVQSMNPDEFPDGLAKGITTKPADAVALLAGYRRVLPAASDDQTRMVLNGVFIDHKRSAVAATDGKRLAQVALPAVPFTKSVILPKSKLLVSGLLEQPDGRVGEAVDDAGAIQRVVIAAGPWQYASRVIEGAYPNCSYVIPAPEACPDSVTLTPEDVELLALVAEQFPDDDDGHSLFLYADNERALVLHRGHDQFVHAVLPGVRAKVAAPPFVTAVNREFLRDGLAMGCCRIACGPETRPLRLTGPDQTLYVLMPLGMSNDDAKAVTEHVQTIPHLTTVPKPKEEAPVPENKPEPAAATAEPANPETAKPATAPGLAVVESDDPLLALNRSIDSSLIALRAAAESVREIRLHVRDLVKSQRGQVREFKAAAEVIEKLKKVAAA